MYIYKIEIVNIWSATLHWLIKTFAVIKTKLHLSTNRLENVYTNKPFDD